MMQFDARHNARPAKYSDPCSAGMGIAIADEGKAEALAARVEREREESARGRAEDKTVENVEVEEAGEQDLL